MKKLFLTNGFGYKKNQLCMGIYRLLSTARRKDAENVQRLLDVVNRIVEEDKDWKDNDLKPKFKEQPLKPHDQLMPQQHQVLPQHQAIPQQKHKPNLMGIQSEPVNKRNQRKKIINPNKSANDILNRDNNNDDMIYVATDEEDVYNGDNINVDENIQNEIIDNSIDLNGSDNEVINHIQDVNQQPIIHSDPNLLYDKIKPQKKSKLSQSISSPVLNKNNNHLNGNIKQNNNNNNKLNIPQHYNGPQHSHQHTHQQYQYYQDYSYIGQQHYNNGNIPQHYNNYDAFGGYDPNYYGNPYQYNHGYYNKPEMKNSYSLPDSDYNKKKRKPMAQRSHSAQANEQQNDINRHNHNNKAYSCSPPKFSEQKYIDDGSQSYFQIDHNAHEQSYIVKPSDSQYELINNADAKRTWIEKDIHIAILHSCPIDMENHGGILALKKEKDLLLRTFNQCTRSLKIYFGVLTKDSLIRCIQRGAQILHISGHGPPEKKLKVENRHGEYEDLDANYIKQALQHSSSRLKLVFVSTCYSRLVAQAFIDANIPHVIAVHSMVQILDTVATKFAGQFYEILIAQQETVLDAFKNSVASLLLDQESDCCCRHEGHKASCKCPFCKIPRCCKKHHSTCNEHKDNIPCCAPNVPHKHADKFLLLPRDKAHNMKILDTIEHGKIDKIDPRVPCNITSAISRIVGRGKDIKQLADFLHPERPNNKTTVLIYGKRQVGCTTVALEVGRFFARPWYNALFPGGIWRINLEGCKDAKILFTKIAQAMKIKTEELGKYEYTKNSEKIPYNKTIQNEIHNISTNDDSDDQLVRYQEDSDVLNDHYIILKKNYKNLESLKEQLNNNILYQCAIKHEEFAPIEIYIDKTNNENKPKIRRITWKPPDDNKLLKLIQNFGIENKGNENDSSFEGKKKLFIFDHFQTERQNSTQAFLRKFKQLQTIDSKILIVTTETTHTLIQKIQETTHTYQLKQREWRISSIKAKDAVNLLLEQSRQMYEFDFTGYDTPKTADDFAKFELFEYLAKSPALIQLCSNVLDKKMPLSAIMDCIKADPAEWDELINDEWEDFLVMSMGLKKDELNDATSILKSLLTSIEKVKKIWN